MTRALLLLQKELRIRLEDFLNGNTLNRLGRILYTFRLDTTLPNLNNFNRNFFIEPEEDKSILDIIKLAENENEVSFDKSKDLLERLSRKRSINSLAYSIVLATIYDELKIALAVCETSKDKEVRIRKSYNEWVRESKNHLRLQPLYELHDKLLKADAYLDTAILHGSCSSMDYTNFSDVDLLLVVKDNTLNNPHSLLSLRKILVSGRKYLDLFDPLNHHGFMINSAMDFRYYQKDFLPLPVLVGATRFIQPERRLMLRAVKSPDNRRFYINRLKRNCRALIEENPKGLYQMKDLLSLCFNNIILYFQIKGKAGNKRRLIELMKKEMDSKERETLEILSEKRISWPKIGRIPYAIRKIPYILNPFITKQVSLFIYDNILRTGNAQHEELRQELKRWGHIILKRLSDE